MRRVRREKGPVTIRRRRIYILPTRAGLVFAVLVVTMLVGATNYNNSLGFALAFLLAGIGLVAMHHVHRNLLHLRVSGGDAEPVFAGEVARFRILLENPTRLPRLGLSLVTHGGSSRPARSEYTDAPAGDAAELSLDVPALVRGALRSPPFVVATRFPLGLFRAWSWFDLGLKGVAYPRPATAPSAPRPAAGGANGRNTLPAGDEEFTGLRAYRQGDPLRRIHWKRTSFDNVPVIKEFADTAHPVLWLDWDALSPLPVEERLSHLCRRVLDAHRHAERYGLRLPGVRLPPNSGETHRRRCLEALALFPSSSQRA